MTSADLSTADMRRKEKLAAILAKEKAKDDVQNRIKMERNPAKFRHTILTASQNGGLEPKTTEEKVHMRETLRSKDRTNTRPVALGASATAASNIAGTKKVAPRGKPLPPPEPEQLEKSSYNAKLMAAARKHRSDSAWAMMSTFADNLAAEEDQARKAARAHAQAEHRKNLAKQLDEIKKRNEEEKEALRREAQELDRQTSEYHRQKEIAAAEARLKAALEREERDNMMHAAEEAKRQAQANKRAAEEKEIAAAQAALQEERDRKAAAVEARRQELVAGRQANEALLETKKAEARQRAADENQRQKEYLELLETQDREREEKLKAFFADIAARANRVGGIVSKAAEDKAAKEEAILREQLAEANRKADAKAVAEKDREAAIQAELRRVRDEQLEMKRQLAEQKKREMEQYVHEVQTKAAEAAEHEAKIAAEKKARNQRYLASLQDQVREREERETLESAVMTVQEAKLNEPILKSAAGTLGVASLDPSTITGRTDLKVAAYGRF